MTDATSVPNLLSYSAQVLCVVTLASIVAAVVRIDAAGVRYAYWRGIGLLCMGLPWLQPRIARNPPANADGVLARIDASVVQPGTASSASTGAALSVAEVVLWVLAFGVAVRLAWVGAGLFRLQRLRRAGASCGDCEDAEELQRVIGARADIRLVDSLPQPVTFGILRPIVLLPSTLRDHPVQVRRAVLAHELLHVQRRDWAWVIVEEVARAIFWFHPAAWWVISNVQLAREEVVDELAVLVTGHRRTYVEALLAFADESPLAPAPAFARRHQLFRRMMLISKEAVMSPKQIVMSCAVMALIVAGGGWYAVRAFPLVGAAQEMTFSPRPDGRGPLERQAVLITPENPIPRRISVVNPEYPAEARAAEVTARVSLQITLDEQGRVAESRLVGLDLHRASPRADGGSAESVDVTRTDFEQRVADAFINAAIGAVRQWRYDPPFEAPISFAVTFAFSLDPSGNPRGIPPPPPPAPPAGYGTQVGQRVSWTSDGALHVGGTIKAPKKLTHVDPVYPPIARAAGVQGVVILQTRIGSDGRITDAHVLKSIPLLDQAALDAVKHWTFEPTLLNGEAVPVMMTLTINFSLP